MRRRRPLWIVAVALVVACAAATPPAFAQPCERWVAPAPAGDDTNPGTLAAPWATLDHASAAVPDDTCTVYFQDGVYTGTHSLYERFDTPTTFQAANRYRAVLQYAGTAVKLFGARNVILQGFELRHTGPGAGGLVMQVQQGDGFWAENITIRDNVFHDSWNNDLLKINNGARFVAVENNVFYNQSGSDEHIDINSVTDVLVQDNVFFNDFAGSGRVNGNDTSSFIVMKDSNAGDDGQIGDERITVRRNVFLNWEGSSGSNFALVGEDGMAYFEGRSILVENNLMLGNSGNDMRAAFGVKGGKDIVFRSNTVVGNLPSLAFACRVNREGSNPVNENVSFRGNIWSDPTGTMGAEAAGGTNEFSDGTPAEATGLALDRNLYWNGGAAIPPGDLVSPLVDDANAVVADPQLPGQAAIVLPRWNGTAFESGSATIREEFERLVALYGAIGGGSPAAGQADTAHVPGDDVLGRRRDASPDLGAFEAGAASALAIAPTSGPSAGGTGVAITGAGFQNGASVEIGGAAATGASVSTASFLTASTPALLPGTLNDVVVTNPDMSSTTLANGWFSDFLDVPQPDPFHPFIETLFRAGITAGCHGGSFCRDLAIPAQADGGAAAAEQARRRPRPAAGDRGRVRRRAGEPSVRGVDRGARRPRDHGRLRQRELLPGKRRDPPPDGGLPAQDEVRQQLTCRRRRRGSSETCLRETASLPGWSSSTPKASPAAARPRRCCTARSTANTRGQMAVFLVKAFGF